MTIKRCLALDCKEKIHCKNLCVKHYKRHRTYLIKNGLVEIDKVQKVAEATKFNADVHLNLYDKIYLKIQEKYKGT